MKCKNRSIGCSKFCDRSRESFRETLEEVKLQLRVRQREAEIIRKMSEGRK
jgi:hypothetical protein